MDSLAEWFRVNGLVVAGVVVILAAAFVRIKEYTKKTETKADDKFGDIVGWIGGLLKAIFSPVFKKRG